MLVSRNAMKTYLGISGTTYDDFLDREITMVSDTIELYCRRKFNQATWSQTFYRDETRPMKALELFHFPLISVTSVEIDGVVFDDDYYRIHKPTARVIRTDGGLFMFDAEEIEVTYVAGYATIPTPLQQVVYDLVSERYNKYRSGVSLNFGSDVQRVSIPGTISIDFDYTLQNNERESSFGQVLGNQRNMLDYWRSERVLAPSTRIRYVESVP